MSDSSSSGASTMSRPGSAPAYPQPQTVTTKVTTTAKLKVELHAPYYDSRTDSSCSNSSGTNVSKSRSSRDFKSRRTYR